MPEPVPRADGRLPLTIVGGFLGAGKSTWLRHQLFIRRFGHVCVLVNEAADMPVDDRLLGRADRLEVLAGGCACCIGWDALLATLRRICDAASGSAAGLIGSLVLETSGLADPAAIAQAIQDDPVLVRRIVLAGTIVLVDGGAALEQLAEECLTRSQIEAADEIVVTKATLADQQHRSRLAATLRRLAPGAALSWTEFGVETEQQTDPDAEPYDLPEPEAAAAPIRAHRLDARAAGGWWALSAWLSALLFARGDRIVRVKGVISTPAGRLLLQSVRRHVQPPEILPEESGGAPDVDFIVLIGRDIDDERLRRSWNTFVGPAANRHAEVTRSDGAKSLGLGTT